MRIVGFSITSALMPSHDLETPKRDWFLRFARFWPYLAIIFALCIFAAPTIYRGTFTNFSDLYVHPPWSQHPPSGWYYSFSVDGTPRHDMNPSDLLTKILAQKHKLFAWNPYNGFGTPWIGAMQPASYYPPKLISYALPDYWSAEDLMLILLLLLAGCGNYLLLRSIGVAYLPAIFSAIAFMLVIIPLTTVQE